MAAFCFAITEAIVKQNTGGHMNHHRIQQIANRSVAILELTVNPLGRACLVDGVEGRVDAAFIDLQAAIDVGLIDVGWFAEQNSSDKTTREEHWYSVVLPQGAVLVGARELVLK